MEFLRTILVRVLGGCSVTLLALAILTGPGARTSEACGAVCGGTCTVALPPGCPGTCTGAICAYLACGCGPNRLGTACTC